MIRAKVYLRETGECQVIFREGESYEVLAEHELWEKTIERWIRMEGVSIMGEDDDGIPTLEHVSFHSDDFPQALKQYIERQFGLWHVEVVAP